MGTTREDIRRWLESGIDQGATHVIVACDTYDHEDYPVYVKPGEKVREKYDEYNGKNMQRVMEVYALHLDIETQLSEGRSFHFEEPTAEVKEIQEKRKVVRKVAKRLERKLSKLH